MRNERRMLGSGRGYGRPGVERSYGARSLLYVRHERGALFFFKGALLARSRPAHDVSCTDGGDRTEGGREALPGSNGWGYHKQSGAKCTGLRPSP